MAELRVVQVYRLEKHIVLTVPDEQVDDYLSGDFETPCSSDPRWEERSDLEHEEVRQVR